MSTKLEFHLYPKGRSAAEPDLMPSVLDSDGNAVLFTSVKRKTSEATVVNLGDSPNANNGDPLRTAFAKINNFIEASYWTNEGVNQKFRDIDSELMEGVAIYSDSDERYSVSLLGDSKFYIRGKAGQIETNFSRKKSVNNPFDWDSEVNLHFQLAHTLETYNLHVNEQFNIVDSDGVQRVKYYSQDYPTTYNERAQNGRDAVFEIGTNVVLGRDSDDVVDVKARIASNLIPYGDELYNLGDSDNKWRDLYLSGNTIYLGAIQIKNLNNRGLVIIDSEGQTLNLHINEGRASTLQVDSDMLVDGLTRLLGELRVKQNARFDSDVSVFGNLTVGDDISTNGKVKIREGLTVDSDVVFSADLRVDSDLIVKGTSSFGQQVAINDDLSVAGHVTFDSDLSVAGTVSATSFKSTAPGGLTFEDDVTFYENVIMDSDVKINGNLAVEDDISTNGKVYIREGLTVDSDLVVKGTSSFGKEVTFSDDVRFNDNVEMDSDLYVKGNVVIDDHMTVGGKVHMREGLTVDSDVILSADLRVDSDLIVKGTSVFGQQVIINDELSVSHHARFDSEVTISRGLWVGDSISVNGKLHVREGFTVDSDVILSADLRVDSDVIIKGQLTVGQEAIFSDDVFFADHAIFDSDVIIRGSLTINGTQTSVNNSNLAVSDNLIVLNAGATTPFNDIGFIYTRYDSDNVSAVNWNTTVLWDETQDQFVLGQTSSSGINPNPTVTQKYLEVGQTIEFFDSDNAARMVWDKTHATLKILNKDGTAAFEFDADSGVMNGNGTIEGGSF